MQRVFSRLVPWQSVEVDEEQIKQLEMHSVVTKDIGAIPQ